MPWEQIQYIRFSVFRGLSHIPFGHAVSGMFILKSSIQFHIILLKWTLRGYQNRIADPFTAPSTENATRDKRDPLRINPLENGILLCFAPHGL
jgi:hypothetical protein